MTTTWVPIGPDCVFSPRDINYQRLSRRGEFGRQGLVNSIAIDPTDAGTIYTTEAPSSGGNSAFRTDDSATSWVPIVDSLQQTDPGNVNPSYIAVHPLSTGYVYLGTYSGRIYTSPNTKGNSWNPTFATIGSSIAEIVIDPRTASNPSTTVIYASAASGSPTDGIWRSLDGGATFTQILSGPVSDFAARFPSDGTSADFYAGVANTGVYHAVDPTSTSSWTNLSTSGTSNLPNTSLFDSMRIGICRLTPRPYVWFFSSSSGDEATLSLYTTANPTGSWTSISMTSPPQPEYGLYDSLFGVAPNSPGDGSNDILLFGSIHLFRSINSGQTWTDTGTGGLDEYHDDYHALAFFPDPPPAGTIPATYIGSDGGLGLSTTLTDPTVTFPPSAAEDDNLLPYTNSAVVQNYSHGKQSSAIYGYNCDPSIGALGYIGCQDTGINAGDSSLLWRGIINADGGSLAVTQGSDGVKIWYRLGGPFYFRFVTDQGQNYPSTALITLPAGRTCIDTSNHTVDLNGNCLAGISAFNPSTSSAAAIATGSQVVTPSSISYIELGSILSVDDGSTNNAENVTVTAVTATTFTATFTKSHTLTNGPVGITRVSDTSIASAIAAGPQEQTVQPGSMENISDGLNLAIDTGSAQETVGVTTTTATTFTTVFTKSHSSGAAVTIPLQGLARVDQSGNASIISQNFSTNQVSIVAVSPTSADIVVVGISDQRLFTTSNATAITPTWTDITTSKPSGLTMASIAINGVNEIFVLTTEPISTGGGEFPSSTPLFWITGGAWIEIPCTNVPTAFGFGKLLADPVQSKVLYAASGARVYRLTSERIGSSVNWVDISNGLPGQWVYDLWVGNINNATTPKVLLRAAVPTRGMWELDVTAGATDPALAIYMRDNFMDMGRLASSPDGIPNPYNPTETLYHYQCADIKVDAQQLGGSGVANFFQTDPESSTPPISHVIFDQLKDNSDNLPSANSAMVHVQVRNRGISRANNVSVWVLFANAGAGLPALNLTPSGGNNFQFWSQFIVTGQILPNIPSDSPWQAIGPPQILNGIIPSNPQVASWLWTVPTLGSGNPGHYCLAAFVHSSGSPINETGYDVDNITPTNKQIGQKNLHIGPPLPSDGSGGSGGGGGGGSGSPQINRPMQEYIEFHNSTKTLRTSNIVIDLRGLPSQLVISFVLTKLNTLKPLPGSITGVISTTGKPGSLGNCNHHHHHHNHHHHKGDHPKDRPCFSAGPQNCSCSCCKHNHNHSCGDCSQFFSQFINTIYTASPSSLVTITGVQIPAYGFVAAYFTVVNSGTLAQGSQHRFNIQQIVSGNLVGGSTYVVKIAGNAPFDVNYEPEGADSDDEGVTWPPWIQGRLNEARDNLGFD